MTEEPARPSAHDIYERVKEDARDELARSNVSLAFSGVFAGFTVGATALSVATALVVLGPGSGSEFVARLLFPIGFIAVILGRAQFFTENTLYPVVLSLQHPSAIRPTLRLWGVVYFANLAGSLVFAALCVHSGALDGGTVEKLSLLGAEATADDFGPSFWSGVIAGWLLALVAWLVEALHDASAQFAAIWFLTFAVGLGAFDHCVATSVEGFAATMDGAISVGDFLGWLAAATLGNVVGGVFIVSLLNYGQVVFGPE